MVLFKDFKDNFIACFHQYITVIVVKSTRSTVTLYAKP